MPGGVHDDDLLATLGIDLDEVRRRALDVTSPRANRSESSAAARSTSAACGPTCAAGTNQPEAHRGVRLSLCGGT